MSDKRELDPNKIPRHIAIIMDGNGRWARKRKLPRVMGHKAGADSVKDIVKAAYELGISYLTLYAFSTENWKRPPLEVQALMGLLRSFFGDGVDSLVQKKIRLHCIGQLEQFSGDLQKLIKQAVSDTDKAAGSARGLTLTLALNYGGRAEIVRAARMLAEKCCLGEIASQDISEDVFAAHLYTVGQPDPDIIIRTGGESRLSNFLLWQASYAEMYVTRVMWPDFRRADLIEAIQDYQGRERRYGKTGEQVLNSR
ncbi:MAG: di-trans,poly-cis-decaprenylcistransferase [Deltaproteobacteria bacterium RIFOXYD12_FULL_57_12]|nr:MAG: di-trans,poly-cis-decaprenylcistransferase [Deltaproteobacteria bacterium RIFOXYD12_FULL_57_12]